MRNSVYLVIIALIAWSCSSEPKYVVKGNIEGSDSIMFYLQKREGGQTVNIDSAVSKKGSFTMKGGKIDYPQLVQLVAGDTRKRTSFYLENSEITVKGTLDSLFKAEIKGSKTQDEYQSYVDSNKPLSDKYSALYSEYQDAGRLGNKERVAEIEKEADAVQNEMLENQKNFVRNHPSSYVSPSLLSSLAYDMEATEIEEMLNKFDTTLAKTPQVLSLKERVNVMKSVAVGQKAPDFTLNDVNGNPVSLSSKIGPKLLLVDFWAAWCGPCREENPNVVKVYKEFNKKGFDVFGVSLDQTKEAWTKAIEDDKLTWTHVSDLKYWDNEAAKLYAVNAIPANFLLDQNGIIIGRNLRGEDLYNKVKETFGSK
ncbi:MAG TPA: redoxin domain-containing protein [Bacteroidales bacterium]|nr:redoxin domain-containing protein [Bacteroidales bacterium]